jgi:hypothetical protein
MRSSFKKWVGLTIIIIGGGFPVTIGQGTNYNDRVTFSAGVGTGNPVPPKPAEPGEKNNVEFKNVLGFKAEAEIIRKEVKPVLDAVVIGVYLLLISLVLQAVSLSSYCAKHKVWVGIIILVLSISLLHFTWFQYLINKAIGLNP